MHPKPARLPTALYAVESLVGASMPCWSPWEGELSERRKQVAFQGQSLMGDSVKFTRHDP